jgi:hypothetical protein
VARKDNATICNPQSSVIGSRFPRGGESICPGRPSISDDSGEGLANTGGFRGGGGRRVPPPGVLLAGSVSSVKAPAAALGLAAGLGRRVGFATKPPEAGTDGSRRRVGGDASGLAAATGGVGAVDVGGITADDWIGGRRAGSAARVGAATVGLGCRMVGCGDIKSLNVTATSAPES